MKTERQVTFHLVYLNAITTIKKKTTSTKKFSPVRAISLCASEDVLTALKAPAEDNAAYKSVFTQESPGYPTTAMTQTTGREGTRVKMGQGKWLARQDSKLWDMQREHEGSQRNALSQVNQCLDRNTLIFYFIHIVRHLSGAQ